MKKLVKRALSYFLYGGITKAEYSSIQGEIQAKNLTALEKTIQILLVLFSGLILTSAFSDPMEPQRPLYCITGFCLLLILLCCIYIKKAKKGYRFILPLCYAATTLLFVYAAYLNICLNPGASATTFCMILIVAPLLLMEKTWRILIYYVLVIGTFLPIVFQVKDYNLAFTDAINSICIGVMGILVHVQNLRVKLHEILLRKQIEKARDVDPLTGCFTKDAFVSNVKRSLSFQSKQGVLIFFDLDHFKEINDTYGHTFGDMVLRTVGEAIFQNFRSTDLAGRFGGDEFLIWLPGEWNRTALEGRLNMLMEQLRVVVTPDSKLKIEISIGVAMYPQNGDTYEALFKSADEALYRAKDLGRNRYVYCQEL